MMLKRYGRITKIERVENRTACITTGIKKDKQRIYDKSNIHNGSNGTYISDYMSDKPQILLYITMYATDKLPEEKLCFDIRDDILATNQVQRISRKILERIQSRNEGKKIIFYYNTETNEVKIPVSNLLL